MYLAYISLDKWESYTIAFRQFGGLELFGCAVGLNAERTAKRRRDWKESDESAEEEL